MENIFIRNSYPPLFLFVMDQKTENCYHYLDLGYKHRYARHQRAKVKISKKLLNKLMISTDQIRYVFHKDVISKTQSM